MAGNSREAQSLIHDIRRGEIVWVLRQDYPHLITFRHLQLALRDRNIPLSQHDLEEYLSYLEESRYARCERFFDERESKDRIIAAALTARGILLFDRKLTDPGVRF
ncbi:MAG: hypothetical protein HYX72_00845 [Acidobacteria bacterium]|nr:hypothetical protein [Acidobacteriota bacterium]